MPLYQLIRGFFPADLVYWNGGVSGVPIFVTRERLAELLKMDEPKWEEIYSTHPLGWDCGFS